MGEEGEWKPWPSGGAPPETSRNVTAMMTGNATAAGRVLESVGEAGPGAARGSSLWLGTGDRGVSVAVEKGRRAWIPNMIGRLRLPWRRLLGCVCAWNEQCRHCQCLVAVEGLSSCSVGYEVGG